MLSLLFACWPPSAAARSAPMKFFSPTTGDSEPQTGLLWHAWQQKRATNGDIAGDLCSLMAPQAAPASSVMPGARSPQIASEVAPSGSAAAFEVVLVIVFGGPEFACLGDTSDYI